MMLALALGCPTGPEAPPVCRPEASSGYIYATEGQPITFEVTCPAGPFELTMVNGPPGAAFEAGQFGWTPTLDQGGSHEATFLAHHRDAVAGVNQAVTVPISVADAWQDSENIPVDPLRYTDEWGLPVLHVDTGGAGIGWGEAPVAVAWKGVPYEGTAHIRGASSSGYPKQSFTLDITSSDNLDVSDQGLGRRDHLVLLTTFDDNSYLRQKLSYDVWRDVSATRGGPQLTPRSFFLIVYVDGQYRGIYVGLDRIDDAFVEDMGFTAGGALYKSVNHDANYRRTDVYGNPKGWLGQGWVLKQGDDWAPLESLVAFAADSDDSTFVADRSRIDVAEFADWYLWCRTVDGGDSGGKNAYLYHDPDTGLLRYSPWDMNYSFGQDWMTLRSPPEVWNDFRWANQIFVHIQDDPSPSRDLAHRFAELEQGPLSADAMLAHVDEYEAQLGPAPQRDWERWGDAYQSYGGWAGYRPGDWTDPAGETAYVRAWIVGHTETLHALAP